MIAVTAQDTTTDALRVQATIHRRMTPEARVELAIQMSEDARAISAAGVRRLHPHWGEASVRREVLIRIYGADLVARAWGPAPER